MANTYKNASLVDVPTSATTLYTAPALTTSIVKSIYCSNTTASDTTVTVTVREQGGNTASIVTAAALPANSSLQIIDGTLVLEASDAIRVTAGNATTIDVIAAVLEIS